MAELQDSRRLPGKSLLLDRPGAIVDVVCPEALREGLIEAWKAEAGRILTAVGWPDEELAARTHAGGASLALTAPIDALYAATEVNEWALSAALTRISGVEENPGFEHEAERLRELIEVERNPALLRLRDAAERHGVAFVPDVDHASVGLGKGSRTFGTNDLPDPDDIDWSEVHDVPLALVTGTNGKSTTVRLLASMAAAAGMVPGYSSTDGVVAGGELLDEGDYSGPEGARLTLRDPRVEVAILETARGGLLRRGLAVGRADAALVTNVAEDHLGEWGIGDLENLARTKLVVGRAVDAGGRLVLNAEDRTLTRLAAEAGAPTAWFAIDGGVVRARVEAGADAAWLEGETLVLARRGGVEEIVGLAEVPITLAGAARHNVANSLAAVVVASHLGIDSPSVAEGLRRFTGSPAENPGRGNLFDLSGAKAIVDYAHNPHGFHALFAMVEALPAERRLLIVGQAGDRSDEAIRDLVRAAWQARPDRIIIKEMEVLLRGRAVGEVPRLMEDELRRLGAADEAVTRAGSELAAVREALCWAKPGDLLLLLAHTERRQVLDLLDRLVREGWRPGDELPD